MLEMAALFTLVLLVATVAATTMPGLHTGAAANTSAILFFDDERLASTSSLSWQVGSPVLLSTFRDPTSFVGWGYPSVWRTTAGEPKRSTKPPRQQCPRFGPSLEWLQGNHN